MNTVTRFAPSPTGRFHAGSYRTALFAYIFAKKNKGKFILRIEDTDKERSKKEYEDNIIESLNWLGLKHDEFYRQSERTEIYKKHLQKLIDDGHAFVSEENEKKKDANDNEYETGNKRSVIRFKNPNIKVKFNDLVRGEIEFDTTELGDFVLAKSMEEPVFHLVNVIDDMEMGMTHIIRGEDHISNTPRQILIFRALGAEPPLYAHIPLLLSKDRAKLSKRHGALSMTEYKEKGYLPAALVNYMSLLGWHPSDDKEIMDFDEIIEKFTIERIQKSGAIFDEEKLKWFNKEYIQKLSDNQFVEGAKSFVPDWVGAEMLLNLVTVLKTKISVYADITPMLNEGGELYFLKDIADYTPEMLLWKKNPSKENAKKHLEYCKDILINLPDAKFNPESIKESLFAYAETNGKGDVLWPLRVALSGQEKSPDPFTCASLLGKEVCLKRIELAVSKL